MHEKLLEILRCPVTHAPLRIAGDCLVTVDGSRSYDVVCGVPIMLPADIAPTHDGYKRLLADVQRFSGVKGFCYTADDARQFLNGMLVPTCGNLFRGVRLTDDYPIPSFPRAFAETKEPVLDIGCNWGRWSIAGAQQGRRMIGVDIHFESLLCARWLARRLVPDNEPFFVMADARALPFVQDFGGAFSYSVVQHFSKEDAAVILREMARILRLGAPALVQMPNVNGVGTMLLKHRVRHSPGRHFDVRYYAIDELLDLFGRTIGPATWQVDCAFGLNVHAWDSRLLGWSRRWIAYFTEVVTMAGKAASPIGRLADSIFIQATKTARTTRVARQA